MADPWISLGVSLVGLSGLIALLRPMSGSGAISTSEPSRLHRHMGVQPMDRVVASQSVKPPEDGQE